jgi:hypothetical protein
MASKAIGARWEKHPLFDHALGGPTPIKFYLRFVTWISTTNTLAPVKSKSVRVMKTNTDDTTETLKVFHPPASGLFDLQKLTDATTGDVSFEGVIPLVPAGGLTIHFEVSGLSSGDWSTAGWKSLDKQSEGKILGFTGNLLGTPTEPVIFLVGVPCWLDFRYQRKFKENPPARFPLGTRIKLISLDSSGDEVDIQEHTTDASNQLKTVLHNIEPGVALRGLIFTRFEKAADDDAALKLNPFEVTTENQKFLYAHASNPDDYAFHFTNWHANLKKVTPWIPAVDILSLCEWDDQAGSMNAKAVVMEMPEAFQGSTFPDGSALEKAREKITLCTALHAATLVREFHSLLSFLLFSRSEWQGLNVDKTKNETILVLTESQGPATDGLESSSGQLRGEIHLPLRALYAAHEFTLPTDSAVQNEYRYLLLRNIILHELGHCLMFKYSFDSPLDDSDIDDHCFNRFIDYTVTKRRVLPFWEGWAVYYSIFFLGPRDFLRSQLVRIAALDTAVQRDLALKAVSAKTDAQLTEALANILPNGNAFSNGIIPSFAVETINGLSIAQVLALFTTPDPGKNIGLASELCLAFSLYNLTRFLVERSGKFLTGPAPSNGDGRVPPGPPNDPEWYATPAARDDLWKVIFQPFMNLKGGTISDTVDKFVTSIRNAITIDPNLKTQWYKIKKIFNTYYLLIEPPTIASIHPANIQASGASTSLTITGTGFVDLSSTTGDGGMSVKIESQSATQSSVTVAVLSDTSLTLTALFSSAGNYTLKLIGHWGEVTQVISVSP